MKVLTILECSLVGLGTAMAGIHIDNLLFWVIIAANCCIMIWINVAVKKGEA